MRNRPKNSADFKAEDQAEAAEIEVFFDGQCPLCSREIGMLRWLDRKKRIQFTDIASPDFDAESLGKTLALMMAEIHGRLPDGSWVVGVEVFRRLYKAIGLRIPVAISRWPGFSQMLDVGYRVFSPLRLKLRPRCTADGACRFPNERTIGRNSDSPSGGTSWKTGAGQP